MRLYLLDHRHLNLLLHRERKRRNPIPDGSALDTTLKEVLQKANQFVPSEAGSILLDDPVQKKAWADHPELVFVACFGSGSSRLLGLRLPVNESIAGITYRTGNPYLSKNVSRDELFYPKIDQISRFRTRSIICAPIIIEHSVCGVIELINRKERENFIGEELKLLEIFAGYTSTLIQNVLDGRRHIELAKRDGLTGLYNDRYFHLRLEREVRQVRKSSHDLILLFMDLDHFKGINDRFGHLTGSHILQEVGEILRQVVPPKGTTVARYGGDEFVIIFSQGSLEEVAHIAERIRTTIKKYSFSTVPIRERTKAEVIQGWLTCSIGIASYKKHIVEGSSNSGIRHLLIRKADAAMYVAKTRGKDRICIASS